MQTFMFGKSSRASGALIAGCLLIAIVAALSWRVISAAQASKPASSPPPVPVRVAAVELRDVPHRVSGIGSVQPLHTVTLRPQIGGVVTQVLFAEGQLVKKGTVLARIDDRTVVAALQQARAQKARNEAQLRTAELDLRRYSDLANSAAVSRQMLEQQRANVQQLQAAIQADEAAIVQREVQLSYTRIVAPINGRVGLRHVDAGNLVQAGDTTGLVTITQLDPISVVFTLPQDLLPRVQPLLQAERALEVTAFERNNGARLGAGQLTVVDNQIDATTGTVRLRAEFPNANERLWPGQFVTVELQTSVSNAATVVPARAVQQGLDGAFVYRVHNDKVEVAPVTLAYADDDIALVSHGVEVGDAIVIDGHSRLKPGARVRVVSPAAKVAQSASP